MPAPWETDYTTTFHHHSYPAISPKRPELSAAGKTVFISGGGRGVGTGIVEAFAEAGAARIIIIGRSAATLEATATRIQAAHTSTSVTVVAGDVTREADVARAFAEAKKVAPGGIDVLIANAGYLASVKPIAAANDSSSSEGEESDAITTDWWRGFEVNVKGVYLQARHFLSSATGPGAVFINISAAAGHINSPIPGFSSYASSKIGAARLVETLQVENPALRFHNIHPGVIQSDMLSKSSLEDSHGIPVDDPQLPGHFLVWLASPEAEFLKGKWVWGNWDVEELKARKEEILPPNKLVTGLVGWA